MKKIHLSVSVPTYGNWPQISLYWTQYTPLSLWPIFPVVRKTIVWEGEPRTVFRMPSSPWPSRLLSLSCHCTFTKNGRVCGDVSASLLSLSTTRSRRWDLYELLGHTARVCQDVPWQHLTHFPGPWNHPPSLKWIFNKKNCPLKEINYERQIDFYFEKIFSFNKTI